MDSIDGLKNWVAENQHTLEREILPAFLSRQRWFGGKSRELKELTIADSISWLEASAIHLFVEARYDDGGMEQYYLPIAVSFDAVEAENSICPIELHQGKGTLIEAAVVPGFAISLFRMIASNGSSDRIRSDAVGSRFSAPDSLQVRRLGVEQSNTSWRVGDRFVLKIIRRVVEGLNLDVEIGRFLLGKSGFRNVPPLAGFVNYTPLPSKRDQATPLLSKGDQATPPLGKGGPGGVATLAILQTWVPNEGDGWTQALGELAAFYERAAKLPPMREPTSLPEDSPPPRELIGDYLRSARTIGQRTAELHLALASDHTDPAFRPEPMTDADLRQVAARIDDHRAQAKKGLQSALGKLPESTRRTAERFIQGQGNSESPRPALDGDSRVNRIRVHGDYHLGQVLKTGDDFVIVDFEGEPSRPLAERRAKHCALKDVAGMVRSFNYAAYSSLFTYAKEDMNLRTRLEPWAKVWQAWVSAAFVQQYRTTAGDASFLPTDGHAFQSLLNFYIMDKAMYELVYELNNRPDWVGIPLQGVMALASHRT